jgi:hypothetical protein
MTGDQLFKRYVKILKAVGVTGCSGLDAANLCTELAFRFEKEMSQQVDREVRKMFKRKAAA